jgi:hypothetical protein
VASDNHQACRSPPWLETPPENKAPEGGYQVPADEVGKDGFETISTAITIAARSQRSRIGFELKLDQRYLYAFC